MSEKFRKTGFDDDQFAQQTPGQKLAAAREAQGQSIEDVVRYTKLSRRQVMALENDAHDQLPGPVFVRGFMRNYARHLQLDAAPLLAALDAKSTPAVIPSAGSVEPTDLRGDAEQSLSDRGSEAASEPVFAATRYAISDSIRSSVAEPVIEQGRAEGMTVWRGAEPGVPAISDAVPADAAPADVAREPARVAQDAPSIGSDTIEHHESATAHARSAVAESNAAYATAADKTQQDDSGESVDNLGGIADTSKAWRNYALVSLAVVIGLLALVIVTQT
ncbi:MAG: helix-turn-helix domain-containing protein [Burkholderiales bacterium]|nr:helix-turn-helix domain-containing protein [Pseudomonadota bacterium]